MRTRDREDLDLGCPFCQAKLARPAEMQVSTTEQASGGRCSNCGALYLLDPTGKNLGEVIMQALTLIAEEQAKEISEMVEGQDYEEMVLNYNWKTHRSTGEPKSFMDGSSRLYVIRVINK